MLCCILNFKMSKCNDLKVYFLVLVNMSGKTVIIFSNAFTGQTYCRLATYPKSSWTLMLTHKKKDVD